MECVLGIDLGTSAVKVTAVDRQGNILDQSSENFELSSPKKGYAEQNPEDWVKQTTKAIKNLNLINLQDVKAISYSGQMHGLIMLDKDLNVLRPAILWNDTRTSAQCAEILEKMPDAFLKITRNKPIEGFTLPKIMWVKEYEPQIFAETNVFLLPKDYLRYKMTGKIEMDYSDAAGTVMLDVENKVWSNEICEMFDIPSDICPDLVEATDFIGNISKEYSNISGLPTSVKVFAGAADNAAGAIGAGVVLEDEILSSVGTSGVILAYEPNDSVNYQGELHFFNHAIPNGFYSMGVTLAAGYSLSWFHNTFFHGRDISEVISSAEKSSIGANGLLFSPYIVGERTPYQDSKLRGSFLGIDGTHQLCDFARAVIEGITFSFKDILEIYKRYGKNITKIIAIGGGAKSKLWMQIQADVFNVKVVSLKNEQGPGMGAAIIAATGINWYESLADCAKEFVKYNEAYIPNPDAVRKYADVYRIYQDIYMSTTDISHKLIDVNN